MFKKKTKEKSPSSLQLYTRTKKPNGLLVTSILCRLTFSYSLACISAQIREPAYSSPTVTLQPALGTRLWKPYRKVPTTEKKKHHSAKIMPFGHFPLPLDENHIHLLSTTALLWSTDKSIPKSKSGNHTFQGKQKKAQK